MSSNYKTLREHPEHKKKGQAAAKKGAGKAQKQKSSKDVPKEKKEGAAA